MKTRHWGTWLLVALITMSAAGLARAQAQDVEAAQPRADTVARPAGWYTLDHHLRVQIGRSRFYGGLVVAGTVVAVVGVGGAARFLYEEPEGSIFATVAIVGASFVFTGVVGLIVSGMLRTRLRTQRDAVVAMPLLWPGGPNGSGGGLALSGVF